MPTTRSCPDNPYLSAFPYLLSLIGVPDATVVSFIEQTQVEAAPRQANPVSMPPLLSGRASEAQREPSPPPPPPPLSPFDANENLSLRRRALLLYTLGPTISISKPRRHLFVRTYTTGGKFLLPETDPPPSPSLCMVSVYRPA